ncbi:MAG: T9SS type A sorting domain-containing protein [Bacteroidales bacterium]|nr:T9SS type A sorting domain-containing protein [Bacteroidales bacterium]
MKQLTTFLLAILLYLFPRLYAQDFWELMPFPDSLTITCLAVNQQGDIFVGTNTLTAYDGVFRSQDAGQTWELVLDMGLYGPSSIAITDNGVIFVLGGGPGWYLTKSSDNGQTWESFSMPDYGGSVKIVVQGEDTLYVSQWASSGAMLLKSENGGLDWEVVFTTENHVSEYISDIAIAPNSDIFVSLDCFYPNMGGVYKATDDGATWEFLGLLNHKVIAVEVNEQGDLFIGVRDNSLGIGWAIYAVYHDNPQMVECLDGPAVYDLAINSAGHIYASTGLGVMVSKDNGFTFDFENSGLPLGAKGELYCDTEDYIYALSGGAPSNIIYRTVEPTVGIKELSNFASSHNIQIAPNPVQGLFQGRFNGNIPDGTYAYTISGLSGNNIVEGSLMLSQNSFSIDISFLPPGFYLLKVNCDGFVYTSKIIKT